ncbi:MAG: hypothetical protein HY795_06110 [Desulfovibrio sp.]|nr:hypothetical protein [Desulfovibrio sp.]MBI4961328.1 hypothetical protein [Desulfovibrio sp.]
MEFFEFADVAATPEGIRQMLTLSALPDYCDEIESVDEEEELGRVVYFFQWGRYHIRRDEVMGGVRFWVPDCPNALAWTVTTGYPPHPGKIVLHATINRTFHDQEFIDATKALISAFKAGLEGSADGVGPKPEARMPLLGDLRGK